MACNEGGLDVRSDLPTCARCLSTGALALVSGAGTAPLGATGPAKSARVRSREHDAPLSPTEEASTPPCDLVEEDCERGHRELADRFVHAMPILSITSTATVREPSAAQACEISSELHTAPPGTKHPLTRPKGPNHRLPSASVRRNEKCSLLACCDASISDTILRLAESCRAHRRLRCSDRCRAPDRLNGSESNMEDEEACSRKSGMHHSKRSVTEQASNNTWPLKSRCSAAGLRCSTC